MEAVLSNILQLSTEAALLMAVLLSREKRLSELAAIFEAKAEAKQVRCYTSHARAAAV